jgi:hypothetical protein
MSRPVGRTATRALLLLAVCLTGLALTIALRTT